MFQEREVDMENSSIGPVTRTMNLTLETLGSETVVYDHERHRVHCLNESTSFIWRECDGRTQIEEIAIRLPEMGLAGGSRHRAKCAQGSGSRSSACRSRTVSWQRFAFTADAGTEIEISCGLRGRTFSRDHVDRRTYTGDGSI